MERGNVTSFVRDVSRLFTAGTATGLSDGELLQRFTSDRDESAFEALLLRHGPMVVRVCRQFLFDPNDVDDAFQAIVLILVRKANSIRVDDSLGPWFHAVAVRVAMRMRAVCSQRMRREIEASDSLAQTRTAIREIDDFEPILHEELNKLPDRFRKPLVLCYLLGHTHEQAARLLNCPVGTIRSRLSRGRSRLRRQLERRGLNASTLLSTPIIPLRTMLLPVPLKKIALKAALAAVSVPSTTGSISVSILTLTKGVVVSMFTSSFKSTSIAVLTVGLLATGAAIAYQTPSEKLAQAEDQSFVNPNELSETRTEKVNSAGSAHGEKSPTRSIEDRNHLITGALRAETVAKTYFVGDLLGWSNQGLGHNEPLNKRKKINMQAMMRMITESIAPGTWRAFDELDKDMSINLYTKYQAQNQSEVSDQPIGTITPFYLSISLIIRHTGETHDQVANLLRQLRRFQELQRNADSEASEDRPDKPGSAENAPLRHTDEPTHYKEQELVPVGHVPKVAGKRPSKKENVKRLLELLKREVDSLDDETKEQPKR